MAFFKYILIPLSFFLIVACEGNSQIDRKDENAYEIVENLDSVAPEARTQEPDKRSETLKSEGQLVTVSAEKIVTPQVSNYQKPGAAVQFSHNYDGVSEQGEAETVTLSFSHGYEAGTISISLEPEEGLTVSDNNSPYAFSLGESQTVEILTTLTADAEGKHYLSIFATVEDLNSNPISRVFALAVNVGDPKKATKKSLESVDMNIEDTSSGGKIILMPAEETISQQ